MSELMEIQEYAQQIAEAIATVTGIDVEIADKNLVRVAGTGVYRNSTGSSMRNQGYVYQEVLRTGKEIIIENPGHHPLCMPCDQRERCCEKYEIAYPINVNDEAVGVIGLLCFADEQARLVKERRDSYLAFLCKMAETISLKVKEREFMKGLVSSNRYLSSIIDCLEEGLLTADLSGRVLHYNQAARSLFNSSVFLPGISIELLLGPHIAREVLSNAREGRETLDKEIRLGSKQSQLRVVLRARPVTTETGEKNIVITFSRMAEISRLVNRFSTHDASYTVDDILGVSEHIRELRRRAKLIASSNSTVLIRGESGTGKEMLARAIHNLSPRRHGPFVAINCSAIPEALLESELFGYEEGAFTGARKGGKLGKIELAHHGTLFLDEIGDMPLFLQAKILRVLQERQIERIGGLSPIPVDVRVIAATHRDLEQMIAQGEFRQDLYYRLNVIPLTIAPLRERKEDIDCLCEHFIKVYNQQLNKSVRSVSAEFRKRLWEYSWPGNVRELQNTIEYAMNLASGDCLDVEHLPSRIRDFKAEGRRGIYNLEAIERETIRRCLQEFGTTVQGKERAAKELGIGIATLYRKIARYGICL